MPEDTVQITYEFVGKCYCWKDTQRRELNFHLFQLPQPMEIHIHFLNILIKKAIVSYSQIYTHNQLNFFLSYHVDLLYMWMM